MTKPTTSHHPGAQTIARAVAILKCFSDARPQMSLADVVRATRLNRATAHRMLAALEKEGLIARHGDGDTYRLGSEVIALGGRCGPPRCTAPATPSWRHWRRRSARPRRSRR